MEVGGVELVWRGLLNVVGGVEPALLSKFHERFAADAKNQLAQNVCVKHDLLEVLRVSHLELTSHVYNHKVETHSTCPQPQGRNSLHTSTTTR